MSDSAYCDGSDRFKAKSYRYDSKSILLALSNWQTVTKYLQANAVQFRVVNEDDRLEWTITVERRSLSALGSLLQLMLPYSPRTHTMTVTMQLLRDAPNSESAAGDAKCYEILNEVSGEVENSAYNAQTILACRPFKDFRPRLRENAGFDAGDGEMIALAPVDSILPGNFPMKFRQPGDVESFEFVFYEGKNKAVICSRQLFKFSFSFISLANGFTVKFDISKDGSLTATVGQEEFGNSVKYHSPQIMDVIGRQLPINSSEPQLTVQLSRPVGLRRGRTVIQINTTYQPNEIQRWQISLTPYDKSRAVGVKSFIFVIPREDFDQTFQLPAETLTGGVQYKIKVDGLQLFDSGTTQNSACKIVCSNSTTVTVEAPVYEFDALQRRFLGSLRFGEKSVQPSIPSARSSFRATFSATTIKTARLKIRIERATFHQATVVISYDNARDLSNIRWKITVSKTALATGPVYLSMPQEFIVNATSTEQRYDIPLQFQPGHSYKVEVQGLGLTTSKETANFRAELTAEDIGTLHSKAKAHTRGYGSSPCIYLYRNKSEQYFSNILRNRGGIMEVYDKDNSGDPASPINLQIKGLFFMATVEQGTNGEPMRQSAFGPIRICIPAEELLQKAPNLYFADYYCMRGRNHYVTLVMTKPGSETDLYCEPRLLKLDVNDSHSNPFFFRDSWDRLQVSRGYYLQVELLFTENLDIKGYSLTTTPTVGKGSSTSGGIPKNPSCSQCNLSRNRTLRLF